MTEKTAEMVRFLYNKKATDIAAYDVSKMTVITDCMLIASGRNAIQVRVLAEELEDHMAELGYEPIRKEGMQDGQWAVLDYGDVLVHLFHPQQRAFYRLDQLWQTESNRMELPIEP